ncbi:MAG: AMP-binding protein [Deferribacterota bacterium]|nr:AMP-binding protein [Deferribacterota bacterium]
MGLKKGDRVATILPTSIQFIISDYAISRAGLIHVPCSQLEPVIEIKDKLNRCSASAVICLDHYLDSVKKLNDECNLKFIIVSNYNDYTPNPPQDYGKLPIENAYWLLKLISNNEPKPPNITFNVKKDIETLLFTGGTTGVPKGCMLTHRNIYANAIQNSWGLGKASTILSEGAVAAIMALPAFHSYGHSLIHSLHLIGLDMILISDPRDTKTMASMIKKYHPVLQIGVPTQFMKLATEELKGVSIIGISGSAPLPSSAQSELDKKGSGVMEGYGLSEMSPVTHFNPSLLYRLLGGKTTVRFNTILFSIPGVGFTLNRLVRLLGTKNFGYIFTKTLYILFKLTRRVKALSKKEKRRCIGFPMPDTIVKFLDVATEEELTIEEVVKGKRAEMCLDGPQRMLGYWPEEGSGIDEDGFIRTGDVVNVDKDGYFYVVDRTKDMIVVSGYKVYSREMDDILYEHPAVNMAATVGVPDPEREGSERVVVYIQPKEEFKESLTEEEILNFLRERVAKYAVPKKVYIVDKIPLTNVQKVDKKKLRQMNVT